MLQPGDIIEGPSGNHYELISKDANGMWTYVQKSDGSVHWGQDFALSTWHLISSKPLTTATAPITGGTGITIINGIIGRTYHVGDVYSTINSIYGNVTNVEYELISYDPIQGFWQCGAPGKPGSTILILQSILDSMTFVRNVAAPQPTTSPGTQGTAHGPMGFAGPPGIPTVTSPTLNASGGLALRPPPSVPQYINDMFANYINSSYVGQPTVDLKHYPHKCPRCNSPAYVGIVPNSIDCSNKSCIKRS